MPFPEATEEADGGVGGGGAGAGAAVDDILFVRN